MNATLRSTALVLLALVLALAVAGSIGVVRATPNPTASLLTITPTSPAPGSDTGDTTPFIEATFSDPSSTVNTGLVFLFVDGLNVTTVQGVNITTTYVSYSPPSILAFKNGLHNITVDAVDLSGNKATVTWNFTVNTNITTPAPNPFSAIKITTLLLYIGLGAAISGAIVGGYILYLRQTTSFTFRRYFAVHPVEHLVLVLYIPLVVAFVFILLGLDYVYTTPGLPSNAVDYVFIIAIFIALLLWGIDSRREMLRIRVFERAFSQFLFEMADAMRGGLDPAKAIVELAKTHTNILQKPLRVASDGIRLGRPFEKVITDMVAPMQSDLITRYATLVADATAVGGETATVVYRAAKDMDDFVKIEEEREKQLTLPVAVIYIAFGILMAVLFALLWIAPELGTLNISFLGIGQPLNSATQNSGTSVPSLPYSTLKERFFQLMIINSLGTGAIIGAFSEGRARYGILHSLALVAATAIAFLLLFP